eukprot:TRINITY_DN6217_c0_g2_i1.p1 TRINITY_DN6217_c0_g2~~TRINITY_DN6217_c0_g2_i1.p1  ORF type:complete len:334 (+),score=64.98 TRINITY_DN6217_c0_g2_i1:65-1066(+)
MPAKKRHLSDESKQVVSSPAKRSRYFKCCTARVIGVDFSGSAKDAGRLTLVAECELSGSKGQWKLHVLRVRTVEEISNGSARTAADSCRALCEELRRLHATPGPQLIVGLDSPPSVAAQFIQPLQWRRWVKEFPTRFPTAEAFRRAHIVKQSGSAAKTLEPKRETDILTKVPFAPQNLRMFRQSYNAIAGVYGPLAGEFAVIPCMRPSEGQPLLFESCPASVLKRLGLYKPSYKSKGLSDVKSIEAARGRRQALLRALERGVAVAPGGDAGVLAVDFSSAGLKRSLVEDPGADGLDAVLAAVGAACATRSGSFPAPCDGVWRKIYAVEACVYC